MLRLCDFGSAALFIIHALSYDNLCIGDNLCLGVHRIENIIHTQVTSSLNQKSICKVCLFNIRSKLWKDRFLS